MGDPFHRARDVNGRVYVEAKGEVDFYGLFGQR